jgi:hypothetical protein
MKLRTYLKDLGAFPEDKFRNIFESVMQATIEEWQLDTKRQEFWDAHKDTESIVLKIGGEYETAEFTDAWTSKWEEIFSQNLLPVLEEIYGEGEITRMIISKLKPKAMVGEHADTERLLHYSHRIHLPIITDEKVIFYIKNEPHFLKEGYLYELSNQDLHRVESQSDKERIHLIVDYADKNGLAILRDQ